MINSSAILLAATLAFLGLLALLGFGMFFAFRFLTTIAILKAAPDAKAAASMLRAAGQNAKTPTEPEKVAMELPATGVDEMASSPEAIKNLRKRQDPSPDPY